MKSLTTSMPVLAGLTGIGILSLMDAVIKEAASRYSVAQVVELRFLAGTVFVLAWALATRAALPTRTGFRRAAVRAVAILATSLLFYSTLTLLPLAEAVAITFVSPFMMLVVSRVLLGEPITRRAVAAIVVGFAGVLVMLAGRIDAPGGGDPLGYLTGLGAALSYAVAMVLTRRDSGHDGVVPLVLAQNVAVTVLAAPAGFAAWTTPDLAGAGLFVAAGLLGTVGHLTLAWAYANAVTSRLAPLEYSAFIWAAGLGFLLFSEIPTASALAGAALITGACIMAFARPETAAA